MDFLTGISFDYKILFNFNFFVFVINFIIAIFAGKIISILDTADLEKTEKESEEKISKKKNFLHLINLIIFLVYFISLFAKLEIVNNIITALFIIMVGFIINSWFIRQIVIYYGESFENNGEVYLKRGYKVNLFSLLITVITIVSILSFLLSVFGMSDLLESGGFIAGVLAFLGFTSPVWAPDMISGIIILHNGRIQYGNVIKIKEKNIKAWVKSISLTEIKLIDLVYGQPILFRPSVFRNYTIENISLGVGYGEKRKSVKQIMDIKIGYDVNKDKVKELCFEAFNEMIDDINNITKEETKDDKVLRQKKDLFVNTDNISLEIDDFGDFAILYKFTYEIKSAFYIIKAKRLLNEYLYKKQQKYGISFSTPVLETQP